MSIFHIYLHPSYYYAKESAVKTEEGAGWTCPAQADLRWHDSCTSTPCGALDSGWTVDIWHDSCNCNTDANGLARLRLGCGWTEGHTSSQLTNVTI